VGASEDEWVAAAVYEVVGRTTDDRQPATGDGRQVYDPWAAAVGWRNVG